MHITVHPENSPSRIQFYIQKTKELFEYYYWCESRVQKGNSTHRRQGDLLEIHPCCLTRPSKDIPGIPATRPSKGTTDITDIPVFPDIPDIPVFPVFPDIPDIPVIHDLPAFPGNSTNSSISRESTPVQHSPIRMHILTVRLVSTENSTEYPLGNYKHYKLKTFILQRKGDVAISVRIDIFSRIELFPSNILSSEKTNCKNDIQ